MGNTVALAPRLCCNEAGGGTAKVTITTRGRGRPKSFAAEVPAGRSRARAGGVVSWAGGVRADGDDAAAAVGKHASAAAAVTVKIVLKRKDAEALVARLGAQGARERKARMDELKGEFRAGGDCVGGASSTPCRDAAWKPRLAPIKEN